MGDRRGPPVLDPDPARLDHWAADIGSRRRCRTAYAILVMTHGPGTLTGRTPVRAGPTTRFPRLWSHGHNLRPARERTRCGGERAEWRGGPAASRLTKR